MPESLPPFELITPAPAELPAPPPLPPVELEAEAEPEPDFDIEFEAPAPRAAPRPVLEAPASGVWPGAVPSLGYAERALADHLSGMPSPGAAHAAVTEAVAGILTPLERGALRDEIEAPDAALALRRAAALRWRLAVTLGTRPPPRAPVDSPALDALMTEVDDVLQRLSALAEQAGPPEVEEAVVALRAALAEQAQRFIRDVHQPLEAPAPTPARPRTPTPSRGQRPLAPPTVPRLDRRWLVVGALLVCALLLAPERKADLLLRPFPGAPAGMLGMESRAEGVILLQTQDHRPPGAEFAGFAAQMKSEGWSVEERYPTGQGAYLLTRRPAP